MTLRLRFLLSLVAVIAIMAVPAIFGVSRVAEVRDIALDLREQAATSALAVGRLGSAVEQFDRYQRLYIVTSEVEYSRLMWDRLDRVRRELESLRSRGYADAVAGAHFPVDELRAVTARLDSLVASGLLAEATAQREVAAAPLIESATLAMPQLAAAIDRHTAGRVAAAERSADAATTAATMATLIALVLAAILAVAAAGVLSSPLQRLVSAMARVADGVFDAPRTLPYHRQDELGDLARSFRAMTERLARLDRMKAEFLGAASQGLKTPIGVIGGYAELIREEANGDLSPRHHELLAALSEQAHVLRLRLDQLLEMSRIESGTLALGIEEIYLRHFVTDLQREHGPKAAARDLRFQVRLDERTPPFILADPDLLRVDILANVIGNAIRYTPRGAVDVVIRPDGDLIVFEVTDTGPGIPPDLVDHIFEKYSHGRDSAGTGLGLALARAAVLAHNGRIDAGNLPGGGARFRIALPATQSSPLVPDTSGPPPGRHTA